MRRRDLGGANDVLLARLCGQFPVRSIRWSADGRWVYLKKQTTPSSGQAGADQLWIVSQDGTQAFSRSGLADDASTFDLHPGAGPLLLEQTGVARSASVCLDENLQPDTTYVEQPFERLALRDTLSAATVGRFYQTGATFRNPRWSPGGTRVAYSSDQNSANVSSDRDLFVGQVSFNHAPTLLGVGDLLAYKAKPFEFYVNASDADGEQLTYQSPSLYLPAGSSFTGATRRFYWESPGPVCSETFVVFRALDGSGGVASKVVKVTTVIDSVDDLQAYLVGDTTIWFSWTAPGENTSTGSGVEYELRYSEIPLDGGTFSLGARVNGMAVPRPAGTIENQSIGGLHEATTYYVAIRTKDTKGNWSLLSNVVQVATTCCLGGGGYGYSAREARPTTGGRSSEITIGRPGGDGGSASVLAAEVGFIGDAPNWSIRQLNGDEAEALGAGDSTSVLLQARDSAGAWCTQARIASRDASWRYAVPGLNKPGRIVFIGPFGLRQAWDTVRLDAGGGLARLLSAENSRVGDMTSGFDSTGTANVQAATTDTVTMSYERLADDSRIAQDWFLLIGPAGSEVNAPLRGRPIVGESRPVPTAFSLRQNQPNPFTGLTTIRFELPVETNVRLEIFDAQGRRVRTLAASTFPAGFHSVEWDERNAHGLQVKSGVYLYRIQAGTFRDQKKMVLLPH